MVCRRLRRRLGHKDVGHMEVALGLGLGVPLGLEPGQTLGLAVTRLNCEV
jgi:hypothetical protein